MTAEASDQARARIEPVARELYPGGDHTAACHRIGFRAGARYGEVHAARVAVEQATEEAMKLLADLRDRYLQACDDTDEWAAINEAAGVCALANVLGVTDLPGIVKNEPWEKLAALEDDNAD